MTAKIWSLFSYPPEAGAWPLASCRCSCLTVVFAARERLFSAARLFGGWRQAGDPRLIRLGALDWSALRLMLAMLMPARCSCPMARCSTPPSPRSPLVRPFDNFTLHNIRFVFFEVFATKLAVKNTFLLRRASATMARSWRW